MVVVEILIGLIIATVVITGIAKIGAPIAEAFAAKLKLKYEELGPEEERMMKARMAALEEEVRALKQQVSNLQDAADFSIKISDPDTIKIPPEKEKR